MMIPGLAFAKLKPRKEIPFIYLDQKQVLHITVIDNVYDGGDEYDRFHYIEETLIEVLKETDFPMQYKISRFGGSRVPKEEPELQLFIHKWGNNGVGEIEVRLNASLKKETFAGRNQNKLGYFRYADGGLIISQTQITKKYNEVLSKALYKLIEELNNHFALEFEEGNLDRDALSPSLGTPVSDE